jgi:hypothetical protein
VDGGALSPRLLSRLRAAEVDLLLVANLVP